jgi:hypothetical protein
VTHLPESKKVPPNLDSRMVSRDGGMNINTGVTTLISFKIWVTAFLLIRTHSVNRSGARQDVIRDPENTNEAKSTHLWQLAVWSSVLTRDKLQHAAHNVMGTGGERKSSDGSACFSTHSRGHFSKMILWLRIHQKKKIYTSTQRCTISAHVQTHLREMQMSHIPCTLD